MRRLVTAAAAVLVMLTDAGASTQVAHEIEGLYDCVGMNPDGSEYRGTVELTRGDDGVFAFHWTFPPGGEAYGLGLLKGDVLSVVFQTQDGAIGLAQLTIDRATGLRLLGPWLAPGAPGLGSETLTKRGQVPA